MMPHFVGNILTYCSYASSFAAGLFTNQPFLIYFKCLQY